MTLVPAPEPRPLDLEHLADQAGEYRKRSLAESTLKACRQDWRIFSAWCADRGFEPLPAAPHVLASTSPTWPGAGRAACCNGA